MDGSSHEMNLVHAGNRMSAMKHVLQIANVLVGFLCQVSGSSEEAGRAEKEARGRNR